MQTIASTGRDERSGRAARTNRRYFGLVPAAIVVAGLYFGRPVLLPLAVAILIAFALGPAVAGLRHLGLGRIFSVLFSATIAIAMVAVIGFFVGTQLVQLADRLPLYQENLVRKIQTVRGTTMDSGVVGRAASTLKTLRDQLKGSTDAKPQSGAPRVAQTSPGPAPLPVEIHEPDATPVELFLNMVGPLAEPLAAAGIVVVFVIFILLHKEDIRDRFIRLAGSGDMRRTTLLLDEGAEKLSHYLLMQTAMNVSFGLVIAAGLWFIGIPNAALWGLAVTIFRFVPYVGVPLAAIFPIVLALSVDPGWSMVFQVLMLIFAGEIVVGQGIEPWLYGRKMGLSPVAIVISASFWTWLWGPIGLLLSTPLTMCLVVLGRHIEHLQFLEVMLGDRPALAAEEALYLRMLGDDAEEAAVEAEEFLKENSLCCYYNDVVLKALGLAQADINRGTLDSDGVLQISETTRVLIQDLSEGHGAASHRGDEIDPQVRLGAGTVRSPVLCIGGRGPLDEAAASLLVNLLEERGAEARVLTSSEVSASTIYKLGLASAPIVCLCYLDPGNLARARYMLRRIQRHIPKAKFVATFWGLEDGNDEIAQAMGCEVVTELEKAVEYMLATEPVPSMPIDAPKAPGEPECV
jgi:predicted PurR-regulated permease PerM